MDLRNRTPFVAERIVHVDAAGAEVLVVLVKATLAIHAGGRLAPAAEQVPLQHADAFHGESGLSSVRYESDLAPHKVGTDVVVLGHAYPPGRRDAEVQVSVRVGPIRTTLAVFGDRTWARPTSPAPFERMPLVYERAFGGRDESAESAADHEVEHRNPVGRGFRARRSLVDLAQLAMPNLEDPRKPLRSPDDRPEPVGLGFIGRSWQPRLRYAATAPDPAAPPPPAGSPPPAPSPFLPAAFDPRYHQGAHPRLVATPHLRGGEPVELVHLSPLGPQRFSLPRAAPRAVVLIDSERRPLPLVLDTVVLEPDDLRAVLVYRGAMPVGRDLFRVRRIEVEPAPA
ncbi:DUF2169 domain-containing protein [Sorangium sp. So ce726]|uniref:DUF2169 family type VI secretion system accessory protein n=1 Tax=Sorangium sp. So ce726 TaxID=3133319 RepID=UPI003F62B0B6